MKERVGSKCPDCEKIFYGKSCRCGYEGKNEQQKKSDGLCEYSLLGKRCRLPGSISPNVREGGPWYCMYHYNSLGDSSDSRIATKFVEKYFDEIMHERRCSNNFYFHLKKCERCSEWQKTKTLKLREMLDEDSKKHEHEDVINF